MYSVYQHWDPLKVCIVGRSYPPEFYSWIKKPAVRSLFEKIAIETEEDYQNIIKKLESLGVEVLRPDLPEENFIDAKFVAPPMTPRDYTAMIGNKFYSNIGWKGNCPFSIFYNSVKDASWPNCQSIEEFYKLPQYIQDECQQVHDLNRWVNWNKTYPGNEYDKILNHIKSKGNQIVDGLSPRINGAMVSRIGKDLYFGTETYSQNNNQFLNLVNNEFPDTRNHIVDTGGHSDGTYCPVCPGLIISLNDVPTYADTFPDWEVVYLPEQSWHKVSEFLKLKKKNEGKWWIPGFENNQDVIDTVEQWLGHWTGYVEETVFDVNMLIVDPKNVIVFNYNKQVFDALNRYGITPHAVPFRHRYFWDGGIHCITSDLHREGSMQNYFPKRS
jgi:glycine amidinotransferase